MLNKNIERKIFIIFKFVYLNIMVSETKHRLKNEEFGTRIVGGKPVPLEEHPYSVQFYNSGAMCAGVILNSWSVLTSAHCVDHNPDIDEMTVQVGSKYIYDFSAKKHKLHSYVAHENYNKKIPFENDIALLFVQKPIEFNEFAKKAILVNHNRWMKVSNKPFIVTGWGWLKVHAGDQRICGFLNRILGITYGGDLSKLNLMMTTLTYVPLKECSKMHNATLSSDMFCLYGDGQRDTCKGDSGGGVLWNGRIVGLTSHGDGCAKKGKPSVYSNVWYLRGWIKKQLRSFIRLHCNNTINNKI